MSAGLNDQRCRLGGDDPCPVHPIVFSLLCCRVPGRIIIIKRQERLKLRLAVKKKHEHRFLPLFHVPELASVHSGVEAECVSVCTAGGRSAPSPRLCGGSGVVVSGAGAGGPG